MAQDITQNLRMHRKSRSSSPARWRQPPPRLLRRRAVSRRRQSEHGRAGHLDFRVGPVLTVASCPGRRHRRRDRLALRPTLRRFSTSLRIITSDADWAMKAARSRCGRDRGANGANTNVSVRASRTNLTILAEAASMSKADPAPADPSPLREVTRRQSVASRGSDRDMRGNVSPACGSHWTARSGRVTGTMYAPHSGKKENAAALLPSYRPCDAACGGAQDKLHPVSRL